MKSDKPIGKLWKHTPFYALRIVFNSDVFLTEVWEDLIWDMNKIGVEIVCAKHSSIHSSTGGNYKFGDIYFDSFQRRDDAIHFLYSRNDPKLKTWCPIKSATIKNLEDKSIIQELSGGEVTYLASTAEDSYTTVSVKSSYEQLPAILKITKEYDDSLLSHYGVLRLHIDKNLRYYMKLLKVIGIKPNMVVFCINRMVEERNVIDAIEKML